MLRLITYLAPSIPADFFRVVAAHIEAACGEPTDVEFEERISGPLGDDRDPFAESTVDLGFICAPSYRWMRAKDPQSVELLPAPVPLDARANGRAVYFAGDAHWNAAGHEIAAKELAKFLAKQP